MRKLVSRRALLRAAATSAAGSVVLAAGPRAGFAQEEKVTKVDAQYRDRPNGQQRCEICLQFRPPNRCALVEGEIRPQGWCQFFAARENAH